MVRIKSHGRESIVNLLIMAFLTLHWLKIDNENGSPQMTVVQKAQLHVAQLRREASKQRINVSDAIMDMKVGHCRM